MLLAVLVGVRLASQTQAPPTFRSGVDLVRLQVTVTDQRGRLVTDLDRNQFDVVVDGHRVEASRFSHDPQPLALALMLQTLDTDRTRSIAAALIASLQPDDVAVIGSFGVEIAVSPWLIGDKRRLMRVLDEELWPSFYRPAWPAIEKGIAATAGQQGRRFVVLVADPYGLDCSPAQQRMKVCAAFQDVRDRAIDQDVGVSVIDPEGTRSDANSWAEDGRLASLARDTGGAYVRLRRDADLAAVLGDALDAMRRPYVLGFAANAAGGEHAIRVTVNVRDLRVRARRMYTQGAVR